MNPRRNMRIAPLDGGDDLDARSSKPASPTLARVATPLRKAIVSARQWLLSTQEADGAWRGELHGSVGLTSQYLLLLAYQGNLDSGMVRKAGRYLIDQQREEGGWARYPDGPADPSLGVQAYFALKLTGHELSAEYMQLARESILEQGGADAADNVTRFFLALMGQISYDLCPGALNIADESDGRFQVASQSTACLATAIAAAHRPVAEVSPLQGIRELFIQRPEEWPAPAGGLSVAPLAESLPEIEQTLLRRLSDQHIPLDTFSALWSTVALKCLGHAPESSLMQRCATELAAAVVEDSEIARLRPGRRTIEDTCTSLVALAASGLSPKHMAMREGRDWLESQQAAISSLGAADLSSLVLALHHLGDGIQGKGETLPPDFDLILESLDAELECTARIDSAPDWIPQASSDAVRRILASQNADGGFGSESGSSSADVTGLALEALAATKHQDASSIERATAYLRRSQRPDGSWPSSSAVHYVHGTYRAIAGLAAVGVPVHDPAVTAGVNWLLAFQQPSGGWGEIPADAAESRTRRQGPTTATHTAWAILGLLAAGLHDHSAVARGMRYLISEHCEGDWEEAQAACTLSDGGYARHSLYPIAYPLLAMSRWASAADRQREAASSSGVLALELFGASV